jgi:hypothetical protein
MRRGPNMRRARTLRAEPAGPCLRRSLTLLHPAAAGAMARFDEPKRCVMSPKPNSMVQRVRGSRHRRAAAVLGACVASFLAVAACGSDDPGTPDVVPTYSELYTRYFAVGTPGHCAEAGCHGEPGFNTWLCGTDKDTCYNGMLSIGLIAPGTAKLSALADPKNSPLVWINPNGFMPADDLDAFPEGGEAIRAWAASGSPNN